MYLHLYSNSSKSIEYDRFVEKLNRARKIIRPLIEEISKRAIQPRKWYYSEWNVGVPEVKSWNAIRLIIDSPAVKPVQLQFPEYDAPRFLCPTAYSLLNTIVGYMCELCIQPSKPIRSPLNYTITFQHNTISPNWI